MRRIHAHRQVVDPISGETYTPNEPDLLMWVHCARLGSPGRLRSLGPGVVSGRARSDRRRARASARLVGLDPGTAPGTTAELDAYMTEMLPYLAYVTKTRFMREMMVPLRLPFTPEGLVQLVITRAAADLPTPPMVDPYGFRWPWLNHAAVRLGSTPLMSSPRPRCHMRSCSQVAGAVGDARLRQGR